MASEKKIVEFNGDVMGPQVLFREILHGSHSAEQHNDYKWWLRKNVHKIVMTYLKVLSTIISYKNSQI
jgi:hypothetical protein